MRWNVAETEHFRVYFDKNLAELAGYIAAIGEEIYQSKVNRYNITLPGKVEMIVRDEVITNGLANPYQNTFQIWVSDWGISLRSTHNWLKDVVAHEFSHLVSIQSGSKLPTSVVGLVIGFQDYFNEEVQSSMTTVLPFTFQPHWFAEGVSQYESQLAGFDSWDAHRDMIMRVAVLEDSLLSYARMGTFAGKGLHWEQGPYTQGYAFVRYLVKRYGDQAVLKLWSEISRMHRQTFSAAMQRILGKSAEDLWEDWKNIMKQDYAEQVKALGSLKSGEKLTEHSFYNYYPRWDSRGETVFFLSNQGKDGFSSSLFQYQTADTLKKDDRITPVGGPVRGNFDVAPDDSTFVFTSGKDKDKNGVTKLDIYQKNILRKKGFLSFGEDPTEKRFTRHLNASSASFSTDGSRIAFVRNELSNFYLCVAPVPEGRENDGEAVRSIFPSQDFLEGKFGFNIYTPKFSPDGSRILFSFYDGNSRNIGWIRPDGSEFEVLLKRPCIDRDPEWLPDGSSFLFSSDSTGIFNLYSYSLENKGIVGVTNVVGGAFSPAVSPDGKDVAYVNYDKDGFSLYLLKNWRRLDSGKRHPLPVSKGDTNVIEPLEFSGTRQEYLGLPNRFLYQPLLIGQELSAVDKKGLKGEPKWLAGLSIFGNDPVYKNEVSAALLLELGSGIDYLGAHNELLNPDKESEFFFNYWNHALPVSLGAGIMRRNIVTFDTILDQSQGNLEYEESNHAITLKSGQVMAKYNLFDTEIYEDPLKASFVSLAVGGAWDDFQFYELPFSFTFFKSFFVAPSLWYYAAAPSSKSDIAPVGVAAFANYVYNRASLFRGGSFRETFVFNDDGVLKPVYKEYTLSELDLGVDYGLPVPWSKYSSVRLSGVAGSILAWKRRDKASGTDTLNSFFQRGIFLRGYPLLANTEEYLFRGTNTLQLSVDFNQVLFSDIFRSYWVVFVEDIYANFFWEAGRAWNGKFAHTRLADPDYWNEGKNRQSWYQSIGWGLKLNSRIYHNYPFYLYVEAATALNRMPITVTPEPTVDNPAPDPVPSLKRLRRIEIMGLPTGATRISLGITLGFYNGLLSGTKKKSQPAHSPGKIEGFFQ